MVDFYHNKINRARLDEFLNDESVLGYQDHDHPDNRFEHPVWGSIMAYREYKPNKDLFEYTVYFKGPLGSHRIDFEMDTGMIVEYTNEWLHAYLMGLTTGHAAEQVTRDVEQTRRFHRGLHNGH